MSNSLVDTLENILVFNCGSSSIKFTIIDIHTENNLLSGIVEALNTGKPFITIKYKKNNQINKLVDKEILSQDNYEFAIEYIINKLSEIDLENNIKILDTIKAVGHRVVHGGEDFKDSIEIDNSVLNKIEQCIELAPLHNPANINGIKIANKYFDNIPHIACFDTAFHQTMPENSYIYPVPYSWYANQKVRKYGFHGMSHKYVSQKAALFLKKELNSTAFITVHLGNGCSACSVLHGNSIDTTMGMTPLEGLMMGTRSGNIDPSIIFYMAEQLKISSKDCFDLLNKKSGLLGVSEFSMDCREIEDASLDSSNINHKQASLAIDLFCYILAKHIAMLSVPLGRLDAIIFTGGIGENSNIIRNKTINLLSILNLTIDKDKNNNTVRGAMGSISSSNSKSELLVIPTNEELMIAKDVERVIKK